MSTPRVGSSMFPFVIKGVISIPFSIFRFSVHSLISFLGYQKSERRKDCLFPRPKLSLFIHRLTMSECSWHFVLRLSHLTALNDISRFFRANVNGQVIRRRRRLFLRSGLIVCTVRHLPSQDGFLFNSQVFHSSLKRRFRALYHWIISTCIFLPYDLPRTIRFSLFKS